MHWLRSAKPSPALVVALIALVVSLSPLAYGAAKTVRHALFADNAGKVNGIKASKKPKPGKLLALNKRGKFPAKVLPAAARGPKGDPGPAGAQGTPGTNGTNGTNGADGADGLDGAPVVARASISNLTREVGCCTPPVAMNGGTWVQAPTESDLLYGQATFTSSGCSPGSAFVELRIYLDGTEIMSSVTTANGSQTVRFPAYFLMEAGSATSHTLTAKIFQSCTGPVTINDLRVIVTALR